MTTTQQVDAPCKRGGAILSARGGVDCTFSHTLTGRSSTHRSDRSATNELAMQAVCRRRNLGPGGRRCRRQAATAAEVLPCRCSLQDGESREVQGSGSNTHSFATAGASTRAPASGVAPGRRDREAVVQHSAALLRQRRRGRAIGSTTPRERAADRQGLPTQPGVAPPLLPRTRGRTTSI